VWAEPRKWRVDTSGPRAVPCAVVGSSGLRLRQRSTITRNSSHQCRAGPSQDQRAISMSPVPPSNAVLPVGAAGAVHDGHVGVSVVQWSGRARLAGAGLVMDRSRCEDVPPSSDIFAGISSGRIIKSPSRRADSRTTASLDESDRSFDGDIFAIGGPRWQRLTDLGELLLAVGPTDVWHRIPRDVICCGGQLVSRAEVGVDVGGRVGPQCRR
jgi:hypothetical protein